jgi:hypothetical protein
VRRVVTTVHEQRTHCLACADVIGPRHIEENCRNLRFDNGVMRWSLR